MSLFSGIFGFFGEYRFLSNFHNSPVLYEDILYPTAEHAYQAAKTNDINEKLQIKEAETPGKAKRLGTKCKLRSDWENVKDDIMYQIVKSKFSNNDKLKALLKSTDDLYLEETNSWNDTYWGVCNGKGLNKLGLILMKVRSEI